MSKTNFEKFMDKLRRDNNESTRALEREYSEGRKGFSKGGTMLHVARIDPYHLSTDIDLIKWTLARRNKDGVAAAKHLKSFLERHPECKIKATR